MCSIHMIYIFHDITRIVNIAISRHPPCLYNSKSNILSVGQNKRFLDDALVYMSLKWEFFIKM